MERKSKIGIVIGTNRKNSNTSQIANYYNIKLKDLGFSPTILDLSTLPDNFTQSALYQNAGQDTAFNTLQKEIESFDKIIFVVPEYNGSFPGVLKAFIDGLKHPDTLSHKKACLVGISSGVLGNAVGLGHLSDILSYLNVDLLGLRLKVGQIETNFKEGEFLAPYKAFAEKQISKFLLF